MRAIKTGVCGLVVVGICGVAAYAQRGAGGGGGQAAAGAGRGLALVSMPVLMKAPTDKAVIFPTADLMKKYAEMEAKPAAAWRLVDGDTNTVNIRIGTNDAPAVHPKTIEFWVMTRGTATVTTGGTLVDGKIEGGVDQVVNPGDIVYIPATVPHGLKADKPATYISARYDMVEK